MLLEWTDLIFVKKIDTEKLRLKFEIHIRFLCYKFIWTYGFSFWHGVCGVWDPFNSHLCLISSKWSWSVHPHTTLNLPTLNAQAKFPTQGRDLTEVKAEETQGSFMSFWLQDDLKIKDHQHIRKASKKEEKYQINTQKNFFHRKQIHNTSVRDFLYSQRYLRSYQAIKQDQRKRKCS